MLQCSIGIIGGFLLGFAVRIMYHLWTGKDIPLFKYSYITHKDGKIESYYPPIKQINPTGV